jgi:hypothetical protein
MTNNYLRKEKYLLVYTIILNIIFAQCFNPVVFRDAATPCPFRTGRAAKGEKIENGGCRGLTENGDLMQNGGSIENGSSIEKDDADEFIFLDCLAYGTGCCSLQVMVIVFLCCSFFLHGAFALSLCNHCFIAGYVTSWQSL